MFSWYSFQIIIIIIIIIILPPSSFSYFRQYFSRILATALHSRVTGTVFMDFRLS